MHPNHQPTPLCGPVPDGMMRLTIDLPKEMFEELEESAWRHDLSLGQLLDATLLFAASHR